jgi:hypothetical protein
MAGSDRGEMDTARGPDCTPVVVSMGPKE